MLLRAIILSLALLVSMGSVISLTTEFAEAGPKKGYYKKKKKKKKVKKYSKAWWKWYKQKQKRQRQLALRKKALKARQAKLAKARKQRTVAKVSSGTINSKSTPTNFAVVPQLLPNGDPLPRGWQRTVSSNNNEIVYIVGDETGSNFGTASFTLVGFAKPENGWKRNKTLAGVELSALRRIVIDRMMREQGWIVNDYQKEINGRKVFVVVAQSENSKGASFSRMFYFTEVDGKIYQLATTSPLETSDKIAEATEKVLANFGRSERAGLR
ncbi:MAG: hypothetical protein D6687_09910 [Acidobacteria bacterium]|jgi:hypothetical protein|nr:MAG: hypothetical protein D6687_09910 [Acidobacteriota bacterium]GIU81224.1 MAG: hypothetical protein KatS3mg006_0288 [Pyrinomonadaceae bacterium]